MAADQGQAPRRRPPFYYPYPITIAGCVFWLVFLAAAAMVAYHFWSTRGGG
jgi:hypothetical protein